MALGFPEPISKDDPRLQGHETEWQASRGGSYPLNQAQQQRANGQQTDQK